MIVLIIIVIIWQSGYQFPRIGNSPTKSEVNDNQFIVISEYYTPPLPSGMNFAVDGYTSIIRNNLNREITLQYTYYRWSEQFGMDTKDITVTRIIPANGTNSYSDPEFAANPECKKSHCNIAMRSYSIIE
jgi:uncharacterized protein YcfL